MRNFVLVLCAIVLIFGFVYVGYCEEEEQSNQICFSMPAYQIDRDQMTYSNKPINKLGRGVINMATFWMEIPAEVAKVSKEKDPVAGATFGVVQGTITSVVRGLTGIYDTVTFMIPSYSKPAMKPEYAWQAADEKVRAWLW